jgi:hypothetical protein
MKPKKKLKGAEALGIKVVRDKSLDNFQERYCFLKSWN